MRQIGAQYRGIWMIRAAILLALFLGAGMAQAETYRNNEMPPYTVESADGAREVRLYGPHILAEVTVGGDRSAAISSGFRLLAGYIFGGNSGGEKVAMTVPVAQTPVDGNWTVSFMMPARYSLATLPVPKDGRVRFVTAAPSRQVAEQFSGLASTAGLEARAEGLRAWAQTQGLTIVAGPHYYFYDGPMTLPWNRRNEVAFTLR